MNSFFAKHQTKVIGGLVFAGIAAMIWIDEHRNRVPSGKPPPELTFKMLDGSPDVTLASLQGQPVVLDFWASWCGPCQASLPHLDELSRKYKGRAHFVAVNAESEETPLQLRTRENLHLTMPIATNGALAAGEYQVEKLPTTVVLDKHGHVAESFVGAVSAKSIERVIERLQD